jgi:hypothetical protein
MKSNPKHRRHLVLIRRWQVHGDTDARNQVVDDYRRLADSQAQRCRNGAEAICLTVDDISQYFVEALLEAITIAGRSPVAASRAEVPVCRGDQDGSSTVTIAKPPTLRPVLGRVEKCGNQVARLLVELNA